MKSISRESGAVSLFVVIFATLLITVVTIGFIRIMIGDQNQASSADLSQSAYDSAQAGVEDAKRVLLRYQSICDEQGTDACKALAAEISAAGCNDVMKAILPATDFGATNSAKTGEVRVQQSSSDSDAFDQAYTCVKIALLTDDYIGSISSNESKLIPLKAKSATTDETDFDRITINWFSVEDVTSQTTNAVDLPAGSVAASHLYSQTSWPKNRPPLMRIQLMQFGETFKLSQFDAVTATGQSNGNTVFLYPSKVTGATNSLTMGGTAGVDRRSTPTQDTPIDNAAQSPFPIKCNASVVTVSYSCSATIILPAPINPTARTAYLRITPLYNQTHYQVTIAKGATKRMFNGVQPTVDSTGRANNLFRRVASRIDMFDTTFPYPEGAVDTSGNLCKDFSVTDEQYTAGECTP